MGRNRTRRNPEWSWDFLDTIWARLKARTAGHPDLMPIEDAAAVAATDNSGSGPASAKVYGNPRRSRSNPRVKEYGTGYYGVVMPTHNPKWVFKITRDASEARFINAIRNLGMSCSVKGLARVSPVYRAGRTYHKGNKSEVPTFAYWRESADHVDIEAYDAMRRTRRTMTDQAEIRILKALDGVRTAADKVGGHVLAGVAELAYADMLLNPLLAESGADLVKLAQIGIVVTDIHLGNWGVVPRRANRLTLIDPGQVVFASETAEAAAGHYRDIGDL